MFGRATIRLGIGPHSSSVYISCHVMATQTLFSVFFLPLQNIFVFCDSSCGSSVMATQTVLRVLFRVILRVHKPCSVYYFMPCCGYTNLVQCIISCHFMCHKKVLCPLSSHQFLMTTLQKRCFVKT